VTTGNTNFIGIEAENTGLLNDAPWPPVQLDAYHRGVAAILKHAGRGADSCVGHKEWAPGRKPDPSLDMLAFRVSVAAILAGHAPAPVLIPAEEPAPSPAAGGEGPRPTLRRKSEGPFVEMLQRKLGVVVDGNFGPMTEAAVRQFQRDHGIVPDGIVGPKTWAEIDRV
jgi:peptidoglycan hydrolase-like protein with peptidoglycan-binding domain